MADPTLHPPEFSRAGSAQEDARHRLTEWVSAKVVALHETQGDRDRLDAVLAGEFDDCPLPLGEDDPRWHDVKLAWHLADTVDITSAVQILEAL